MGRTVDTQKQQIRDRVPGKSLKDKMTHLYLENPERKVEEYMMKLSLSRDQVYGLKHIVKKALDEKGGTQGQVEQTATRSEPQYVQTSISENELPGIEPVSSSTPQHSFSNMEDLLPFDLDASANESTQQKPVEQTPPVYQQPVYQQPVQEPIQQPVYQQPVQENTYQQQSMYQQQPVQENTYQQQSMYQQQPVQENTYQQQSMYQQQPVQENTYQQEPVEQVYQQQSYQQPIYQQQQPTYQQEPMQQPVQLYQTYQQQPIEQAYQQQPISQQKSMYQPIPVQRKPVQHLVLPTPEIDINLSDVDGVTLKSFLAITSDKVKNGAKYKLELKLVEC